MKKIVNSTVSGSVSGYVAPKWGNISGDLQDQTDVINFVESNDNILKEDIINEASKRNESVELLNQNLENEKSERLEDYADLNNKINNEAAVRRKADEELAEMSSGYKEMLDAEKQMRKSADLILEAAINQEVAERKQAIENLDSLVEVAKESNGIDLIKNIVEENGILRGEGSIHLGTASKKDVDYFDNKISQEVNERKAEDIKINSNLNKEISDRSIAVGNLSTSLNNEITTRTNQYNQLSTGLTQEVSVRQSEDNQIKEDHLELKTSNAAEHLEFNNKLDTEITERELEDALLQAQIDGISVHASFIDVVKTHADLISYPTSELVEGDIIRVIRDETKNDCSVNYKWKNSTWNIIGTEGPYYTKEETNNVFVSKDVEVNGHKLNQDINLTYSDVGALSRDTIIGNAEIVLRSNGIEVGRFNTNQTNNRTIDINSNTKLSQMIQDTDHRVVSDDQIENWDAKQDGLISGQNLKTINGVSLLGSGDMTLASMIDDVKVNGTSVITNRVANITVPTKLSELQNNNLYATQSWVEAKNYLTQHQSLDSYATRDWVNNNGYLVPSSLNGYATENYVNLKIDAKQDKLVSGTNIKTIGGDSILGSGNIALIKDVLVNDASVVLSDNKAHIDLSGKQDKLVSGTNIKTINNQSILGSGNIEISGGGEPAAYLKSAAVSENKLILTNKDNTTVVYEPVIPANTSDLVNDGEDGEHPFITGENYYKKSEIDNSLALKQDLLPTVIKGKYLHANNDTGNLEWADAAGGGEPTLYLRDASVSDGKLSIVKKENGSLSTIEYSAPKGDKGDPGVSMTIGTTTTGAAGSAASVTNTGTSSDPILNFTIPKGDKGETGETGPQGPAGETGAQGPTGPQGNPGSAATIAVGTVTTGAPGSSAVINNVGTSSAAIFDFTIPQGPQGVQGEVGPQGPTGETGPQGPKGEDGANTVSVSATGTSTNLVSYITINGVESKLAGGSASGVSDVIVDGQSIVSGGVATLPIASTSAYGVIKARPNKGTTVSSNMMCVVDASEESISARTGYGNEGYGVISTNNIDETVKAALTDGVGAAYSDTEKKAARTRLGAQETLVAGANIQIAADGKTISATGGGLAGDWTTVSSGNALSFKKV